jgi:hypothetical protein
MLQAFRRALIHAPNRYHQPIAQEKTGGAGGRPRTSVYDVELRPFASLQAEFDGMHTGGRDVRHGDQISFAIL